jgi:hypothetical protein
LRNLAILFLLLATSEVFAVDATVSWTTDLPANQSYTIHWARATDTFYPATTNVISAPSITLSNLTPGKYRIAIWKTGESHPPAIIEFIVPVNGVPPGKIRKRDIIKGVSVQ